MKKPIMKNHFIIEQITDLERLIVVLMTDRTIYVQSWHKVHPTSFFNKRKLYPIPKLIEMMNSGEFWRCIKKDDIAKHSFRRVLMEASERAHIIQGSAPTVDEAAMAIRQMGMLFGKSIGDLMDEVNANRGNN